MADRALLRHAVQLLLGARSRRIVGRTVALATSFDVQSSNGWIHDKDTVAFGVGRRVRRGQRQREVVLKVYVARKLPLEDCAFPIPQSLNIPRKGMAPIDVVELGRFRLHSTTLGWTRPVHPGVGIGHESTLATGTLGCFVRRAIDGDLGPTYLLTCAHVLTPHFPPIVGGHIVQPSPSYGGSQLDRVATFTASIPLVETSSGVLNVADAAIARLDEDIHPDVAIPYVGLPAGVNADIRNNMVIRMVGAASGETHGRVVDSDFALHSVKYRGANGTTFEVDFRKLVLCTRYGAEGDSGAPVFDEESRLIGLHMGGFDYGSVFCPIVPIMRSLGLVPITR